MNNAIPLPAAQEKHGVTKGTEVSESFREQNDEQSNEQNNEQNDSGAVVILHQATAAVAQERRRVSGCGPPPLPAAPVPGARCRCARRSADRRV